MCIVTIVHLQILDIFLLSVTVFLGKAGFECRAKGRLLIINFGRRSLKNLNFNSHSKSHLGLINKILKFVTSSIYRNTYYYKSALVRTL